MYRIKLDEDIKSVSEFRAHATDFINQVKATKRPLVLTQYGKSSAVLMDVSEYEKLLDKTELIEDIQIGQREIAENKGIEHDKALGVLLSKFEK